MSKLIATVNGTGAALYLGLGFIPRKLKITNVDSSDLEVLEWDEAFRAGTICPAGIITRLASSVTRTALTYGLGVEPYYGGDLISTASTAYQILADMVDGYAGDMRSKGTLGLIDKWTLTTSANRTGKFNAGANTTYVGVGSPIWIQKDEKVYETRIAAISNDGDANDEVTLQELVPSGEILRIGYMYDFISAAAGKVMPKGIVIKATSNINESGEIMLIEAEA